MLQEWCMESRWGDLAWLVRSLSFQAFTAHFVPECIEKIGDLRCWSTTKLKPILPHLTFNKRAPPTIQECAKDHATSVHAMTVCGLSVVVYQKAKPVPFRWVLVVVCQVSSILSPCFFTQAAFCVCLCLPNQSIVYLLLFSSQIWQFLAWTDGGYQRNCAKSNGYFFVVFVLNRHA